MENPTASVDPEAEFFASKKQTGNEWELYKENVRPLKRGRNVELLNEALKSQTDNLLKKSLLDNRRKLVEAIDEYTGEDPLQPWLECIKWVQESFPSGGECSGLVVIYEQCVRTFWHDERYKDDLRYLKVWLEYAENCADAEVIYSFLEANQVGLSHSVYYISYAQHLESKHKMKKVDDIFNLGVARKAQPLEKLEVVYRKFLVQSAERNKDDVMDNPLPVRSFGTVLATGESRRQQMETLDHSRKKAKLQRTYGNTPLSIYNDMDSRVGHQPGTMKSDLRSWHSLGTKSERNKENTSVPTKWTSFKVPQKNGSRTRPAGSSACIEVFADDEFAEWPTSGVAKCVKSSSTLQLRHADHQNLKKETELLKENPLRNFPASSLPR